jgi:putative PIN family toxin of toxin-antitoxin system
MTSAQRVVIDTNVVLDCLVFADPAALTLWHEVGEGRWAWCVTPAMLDELRAVLERPLPERWENARKLALTLRFDDAIAAWHADASPPAAHGLACRDPNDQMFIDLALCCSPSWLVTRDSALLALRRRAVQKGVVVATPEQWLRAHTP